MAAQNLKLVCMVAMLSMLVLKPMATAALSCGDVQKQLSPCITYMVSLGTRNEDKCCDGVRNLNKVADHQAACKCIKSKLGGLIRNSKDTKITKMKSLAKDLPGKCGVNVPYEISDSTNCDDVK